MMIWRNRIHAFLPHFGAVQNQQRLATIKGKTRCIRVWDRRNGSWLIASLFVWPQALSCNQGHGAPAEGEHVNASVHINGDLHVAGRIFVGGIEVGAEEGHAAPHAAAGEHAAAGHHGEVAAGTHGEEPAHAEEGVSWSYEGENGPEHWGTLAPNYSLCARGQNQSPIDIEQASPSTLGSIEFSYQQIPLHIANDGHTTVVDIKNGGWVEFAAKRYDLERIKFHSPSEHRVRGRAYDFDAQLIHTSSDGEKLIVSMPYVVGNKNPAIESMWKYFPSRIGESSVHEDIIFSVEALLPPHRTYYTYIGSLTEPPCTEGVRWILLKTPTSISAAQVERFRRSFPVSVRPIQALNARSIGQGR
jgi:carbonic anhydrase